jgi:hypothetical protein
LSTCDWIPDRIVFARRNGPRRADRILLVGFEELDTTKAEATVYQIVMLVLLSLVPALTIIDFWELAGRGRDGNFKEASLFKSRRHFSSAGRSRHLFRLIQRGKYGFRLCVSLAGKTSRGPQ